MPIKKRLVRIGPMQLGKMLGALYGAMGLIFIPFFGIFALAGAFAPRNASMPPFSHAAFAGFGIIAMILFPLIYAVMGFMIGIVGAAIYNLFAKWIGGIEVEVE